MQTSSPTRKAKLPARNHAAPQDDRSMARHIVRQARQIPDGVVLLVSSRPSPVPVSGMDEEHLSSIFNQERLELAYGITSLMAYLGPEIRKGEFYLETLVEESVCLPSCAAFSTRLFKGLKDLQKKGMKFSDLPESFRDAQNCFVEFALTTEISPEYLLGNLEKALHVMRRLGVRNATLNVSTLHHNYLSGFHEIKLSPKKRITVQTLLIRANELQEKGVSVEIFKKGIFNKCIAKLNPDALRAAIEENAENAHVSEAGFKEFLSSLFALEEKRLESASSFSIKKILEFFKLPEHLEKAARLPSAFQVEEVIDWHSTPLGKTLHALTDNMDWPSYTAGLNRAGEWALYRKNKDVLKKIKALKDNAEGTAILLLSGREGKSGRVPVSGSEPSHILFDLYCIAVLEKEPFPRILDIANEIVNSARQFELNDAVIPLEELIRGRCAGAAFASLFNRHGLLVSNSAFTEILRKLKNVQAKVSFSFCADEGTVLLQDADINAFRHFIVRTAKRARGARSPEHLLSTLQNKIIPEIEKLPGSVIAKKPHDLGRVIELSLEGIPPRYPLRRPWMRVHLDRLAFMGCGLEPGVRNCQGCPVNNIYERVIQTSLALGYDDIITYEATGCFEVYTGIWPYTGKKFPSLHGVFGGAASEMLGGLAAKQARLKYALKCGKKVSDTQKVLHLGWGGDGATFDIGFGNLSGLYSRLQKFSENNENKELIQRALYVCYDNEGYQNTGNQFSAATPPGSNTTTCPSGAARPIAGEFRKKPIVEIFAGHGIPFSARMNIHRVEHISRCVARAIEDGTRGSFLHFLQPCTTGWKMLSDDITYEMSFISEEGGIFTPVSIEHGVPYLEVYPVPRNPEQAFFEVQARFRHLQGQNQVQKEGIKKVLEYYRGEWVRNLYLTGFDGEIPGADSLRYLEGEHRQVGKKV